MVRKNTKSGDKVRTQSIGANHVAKSYGEGIKVVGSPRRYEGGDGSGSTSLQSTRDN